MAGIGGCVLTGFTCTLAVGGMTGCECDLMAGIGGCVLTGLTCTLDVGGMTGSE
ncbi:hypothetical protein PISMIDRAFT_235021 [Pisolithus microcarpus 441]|uniref:Uncharacterized protein n=1 Tax=Pisolithus microcarpus 441 TaxID=765257 RepID=A0A0C9YKE7_9AGAM|nr:hypothetical protein BKA83DRAFT_235021 [Pisolithus microcarpus]KIK17131.1 hypothetical protein PISMIDRAFT_235021 [Pisolithus microcarpus 441]